MFASIALLAVAACTTVQVEDAGELEPAELAAITHELAEATAAKSRAEVKQEVVPLGRCPDDQRAECAAAVSTRTRCRHVILLRLFGGLSNVRVEAYRLSPGLPAVLEVRNVPRRSDRAEAMDRLTAIIAPLPEAEPVLTTAPPVATAEPSWLRAHLSWVLVGGAVVAVAAGAALEVSSLDARDTLESEVVDGARAGSLEGRVKTHGVVGQALLGAAGALMAAGLVVWAF